MRKRDEHRRAYNPDLRHESADALFSKRRWRIRHVFLMRRTIYRLSKAAQVLGFRREDLIAMLEEGRYEAEKIKGEWWLTWPQLAHIALGQWPWSTVFAALGKDARQNLPYLLQPVGLHAVVPRYQYIALKIVGARELLSAEAFLTRHLDDLASAESEVLENYVPGFVAAVVFPDEPIQPEAANEG
jgi:hypothetical protein